MSSLTSSSIFIASDHAGLSLKTSLVETLSKTGLHVTDLGTNSTSSCDYPNTAHALCHKVLKTGNPGVLICGTGIGMSIAANRFHNIRAALCTHEFHAHACRAHNNANILCLGARITAPALATELIHIFLNTAFQGGRHEKRIELLEINT